LPNSVVDFARPTRRRLVLDLGSGTGVGSRAALSAGARVIAADLALGMLLCGRDGRPPAAAGDALALPFRPGAFDIVLAPFSLNHLDEPAAGVREAGRVGDLLVASTYAADDDHPAKAAVDQALSEGRLDATAVLRGHEVGDGCLGHDRPGDGRDRTRRDAAAARRAARDHVA
jgi:ubiquinone/menaquinone biosynthesis C-methylase UbiE